MGCPCQNKNKNAVAASSAKVMMPERTAPSVRLEFVVRGEGHPLACEQCLGKHLGTAYVLSSEVVEDESRRTERLLCMSNLRCAAEHAKALGRDEFAKLLNEAKREFCATTETAKIVTAVEEFCGGDTRERMRLSAIGQMSAAEQMLRLCGGEKTAERIRAARLDFAGDKEGSDK